MKSKFNIFKYNPAIFCLRKYMVGFFLLSFIPSFLSNIIDLKCKLKSSEYLILDDTISIENQKAKIYITEGTFIIDNDQQLVNYELIVHKKYIDKSNHYASKSKKSTSRKKYKKHIRNLENISINVKYQSIPISDFTFISSHIKGLFFYRSQHNYQKQILSSESNYKISGFYYVKYSLVGDFQFDFLSFSKTSFSVRPPPFHQFYFI